MWGVCHDLSHPALEDLTGYEGGYRLQPVQVTDTETRQPVTAWTYLAESPGLSGTLRPTADYLATIVRGMREHGAPEDRVEVVRREATSN